MTIDEWRPVIGYEGLYEVSNFGRVRSLKRKNTRGRMLKGDRTGRYIRYRLSKEGDVKVFSGHRLTAIAFIPNPNNKPCVNHIDNNRFNNTVLNLEWVTSKENSEHEVRKGRVRCGEKNNKAKLKETDIPVIRKSKLTLKELGKIYNVHFSIIHDVKKRSTWKHIT